MGKRRTESGFTITEMIVAFVVLSLFLTMFFQMFLANQSQQVVVIRSATANDISQTNLRKIASRSAIPPSTTSCDSTTGGAGNPNNLLLNSGLDSNLGGSIIATNAGSQTWLGTSGNALDDEDLSGTNLPSNTVQELRVLYPYGCDTDRPAKIISRVQFDSEEVIHASYLD